MSFRFRKFNIYQEAKMVHKDIVILTANWSNKYLYLADQIKRSSLSIVLNIAEGSSKQSDKDFNRYIAIALGSVDETIACFEVALALNLISKPQFDTYENRLESMSRQLGGLSKVLKNSSVSS